MKFVKLPHCVFYCDYYIVITTKYRHQWLNKGIFAYLETKLLEIRGFGDVNLEFGDGP